MSFSQKILAWYDQHGRHDLPWQKKINCYRVFVSEIMLQQTQVTTVIPYFEKFMRRFPTVSSLAAAPLDQVFELWAGLGYYARAKNLHKAAQIIHTQFKGKFPTHFETVLSLPGIGRSTAGAILSISENQRHPILDGNVKRVLARHFAVKGAPNDLKTQEALWALSEKNTPTTRVNHYTQAMMDLGATLCTRSRPQCKACPVANTCQAKKMDRVADYPAKNLKKMKISRSSTLIMLVDQKNAILLEKRPTKGIWGGLWSFPECATDVDPAHFIKNILKCKAKLEALKPFQHIFTHFELTIYPVLGVLQKPQKPDLSAFNHQWYLLQEAKNLGIPAPVKRLLTELERKLLCPVKSIA